MRRRAEPFARQGRLHSIRGTHDRCASKDRSCRAQACNKSCTRSRSVYRDRCIASGTGRGPHRRGPQQQLRHGGPTAWKNRAREGPPLAPFSCKARHPPQSDPSVPCEAAARHVLQEPGGLPKIWSAQQEQASGDAMDGWQIDARRGLRSAIACAHKSTNWRQSACRNRRVGPD